MERARGSVSEESPFTAELTRRGVSRREFLHFCGVVATVLALPRSAIAKIAEAIESGEKPTLVWLEFQDCAGNTESFLRAGRPTVADIVLDLLSVDSHETIMAVAGRRLPILLLLARGTSHARPRASCGGRGQVLDRP